MPSPFGADPAAVLAHTHRGYERLAIEQALRDADLARPSLARHVVRHITRRITRRTDAPGTPATGRTGTVAPQVPSTGRA